MKEREIRNLVDEMETNKRMCCYCVSDLKDMDLSIKEDFINNYDACMDKLNKLSTFDVNWIINEEEIDNKIDCLNEYMRMFTNMYESNKKEYCLKIHNLYNEYRKQVSYETVDLDRLTVFMLTNQMKLDKINFVWETNDICSVGITVYKELKFTVTYNFEKKDYRIVEF